MHQLAYDIQGAAQAANISEHAINLAIAENRLPVRVLDGKSLILHCDMKAWLKRLPKS